MVTYVAGAIAGLVLGGVVGVLKNIFIWQKYLKKKAASNGPDGAGEVMGRLLASNIVNVATLALVYFLRNIIPFEFVSFIVGTAVSLSIMNKVLANQQKKLDY